MMLESARREAEILQNQPDFIVQELAHESSSQLLQGSTEIRNEVSEEEAKE